jgi:hypothetical protein
MVGVLLKLEIGYMEWYQRLCGMEIGTTGNTN